MPVKSAKLLLSSLAAAVSLSLTACQPPVDKPAENTSKQRQQDMSSKAETIAHKYMIIDTHIDVPYRLEEEYEDVSTSTVKGDFDYPRAVKGGLDAPFMSIYIPAELEQSGGSKELADKLIDDVEAIVNASPDKFSLAYSTEELEANFKKGLISLPMGMENGSPIEGDLDNLTHFYQRGIRYITLAHSKANHISDSSYDPERPAKGLTEFGKKLITEMNKIGIMVDVSHISDDAFYQVMEISKVPVIASHSSARHFTPGFERNMSDDMIKLLAKNGGVIQINFASSFVNADSMLNLEAYNTALQAFLDETGFTEESQEAKDFTAQYRADTPFEYATIDDVLDHFDHVVKLGGIDSVGVGSDYDGVGDTLPSGLKDVSGYPNLIEGLLSRGYSEQDIAKILGGNVLRVWRQVEEYAAHH